MCRGSPTASMRRTSAHSYFAHYLACAGFPGRQYCGACPSTSFFLPSSLALREVLSWGSNTPRGFAAGSLTGVAYAAVRHPYDVLRATSEATGGPKKFRGVGDVFRTALREKPSALLGLYRGFASAACGRLLQFGAQFGVYNANTVRRCISPDMCFIFLLPSGCNSGALFCSIPFYPSSISCTCATSSRRAGPTHIDHTFWRCGHGTALAKFMMVSSPVAPFSTPFQRLC
ncbi:hypothetical protein C3747_89g95 [Trypanosoma cruzi]|uniref:Mitochondrial carrier protein n=1 Tax=Trypanosoma cruzi TaxID=5693 RepID=A0A2V2WJ44_TRYCR|nr:hypothetical protein C3747_89g95 [Trypanosoma cruzi]